MAMMKSGRRRPTKTDLEMILELIPVGKSVNTLCEEHGLDRPSVTKKLGSEEWRHRYAHARRERVDFHSEQMMSISMAATLGMTIRESGQERSVDVGGGRLLLDTMKWFAARVDPEGEPVQKIDLKVYEAMSSEERLKLIAELSAKLGVPVG